VYSIQIENLAKIGIEIERLLDSEKYSRQVYDREATRTILQKDVFTETREVFFSKTYVVILYDANRLCICSYATVYCVSVQDYSCKSCLNVYRKHS
jgi:hypothetical protein